MLITTDFIQKRNAGTKFIDFFERNFPNGLDLLKYKLHSTIEPHITWINWLESELSAQFDVNNRLIRKKIHGEEFSYEYDSNGNLIEYDEWNGKERVKIICKYDLNNQIIEKYNLNYNTHQYWEYDNSGYLIKMSHSTGEYVLYKREEPNGKLIEEIFSEGYIKRYIYYSQHFEYLLIQIDSQNVTVQEKWTYSGRKLETIINNKSIFKYEYNSNGKLIKETLPNNEYILYEYDNMNNLIKTTFPDNAHSYKSYDNYNRLIKSIERTGDIFEWKYDSIGNIIEQIYSHRKNIYWKYKYNINHLTKIFKNKRLIFWLKEIS